MRRAFDVWERGHGFSNSVIAADTFILDAPPHASRASICRHVSEVDNSLIKTLQLHRLRGCIVRLAVIFDSRCPHRIGFSTTFDMPLIEWRQQT